MHSETIIVRVSPEQKEGLLRRSQETGLTVSHFIRQGIDCVLSGGGFPAGLLQSGALASGMVYMVRIG